MTHDVKRTWFFLNVVFILSYAMRIARFFVRLPLPRLPTALNTLVLFAAYAAALSKLANRPAQLLAHPNALCALFFLTFPPAILHLPFFLLSVYHANTYVLANQALYRSSWAFPLAVWIEQHYTRLGQLAMLTEALSIPLAFILYPLGRASLKNILALCLIVRQQYYSSAVMRGVLTEILGQFDKLGGSVPAGLRDAVLKIRARFASSPAVPAK